MKILVTGHRGFIGTHLGEALKKSDHEWHGYDLLGGNDIRDRRKLEQLFEMENFDFVIHLAALAGVRRGELYPEEYISTNVMGTKNVVDMCEKYNVKQLINFSSSSVYGGSKEHVQISEYDRIEPLSIYGMTKLMAEQIVNRSKVATIIIRPFTVYGPNGRKDQVIMRWIDAMKRKQPIMIYADGFDDAKHIIRGYTHVADLIAGISSLMAKASDPNDMHQTFNVGGDTAVSLSELLKIFEKTGNVRIQFMGRQPGDVECSIADTTRIKSCTYWKPEMDFEKEVQKLIRDTLRS